jgi:hypothetical protein
MNPIHGLKAKQCAQFSPAMRSISCVITVKSIIFFLIALLFFASSAWARPTTED